MSERDKLLYQLSLPRGDEEIAHITAERFLQDWMRTFDVEVAEAWENARHVQNWWYA